LKNQVFDGIQLGHMTGLKISRHVYFLENPELNFNVSFYKTIVQRPLNIALI